MEDTTLADVYRELKAIRHAMITREELAQLIETLLILSNKDTMRQIEASEEDIADGRITLIHSLNDL